MLICDVNFEHDVFRKLTTLHSYRQLETTEHLLKLEKDLLRKDQEILTLRNELVDLSCGVCKLRNELDVKNKTDELKKSSEPQAKLAARLALLETELTQLSRSKTPENDRVAEVVDARSDSTGSTLLISDVNFELAVNSESTEFFLEKPDKSEFVGDSQMDRNLPSKQQIQQLQIAIYVNESKQLRMADRNGKVCQFLKTLEAESQSPFRLCRSKNECLQQEVNIKPAVRTYASFCSKKANELRSEMAAHRENEACLEKRLHDLEKESAQVRNEMTHGMLEFSELKEKKKYLLEKLVHASRVVDHLNEEIVGLNAKVLAIKDLLNSDIVSMAIVDDDESSPEKISEAERVKLSSLLSKCNRTTKNDGSSSGDGNDLCLLYDNLESKLSWLSCELLTKENDSTDFLSEKTQLQNELEECEKGLTVCLHCNCEVLPELEENRKRLEGGLLSQAQDTSRLESEICQFMEYRQRLEGELDLIKGQISNLEDELGCYISREMHWTEARRGRKVRCT